MEGVEVAEGGWKRGAGSADLSSSGCWEGGSMVNDRCRGYQ